MSKKEWIKTILAGAGAVALMLLLGDRNAFYNWVETLVMIGILAGGFYKGRIREFLLEEDGVSSIEIVLLLVVLIGLVLVFKSQINKLLTSIFTEINKQAKEVY